MYGTILIFIIYLLFRVRVKHQLSFLNMYGTKLIFIIYLLFKIRVKHRVFWMCMVPFLYLSYIYFSGFGWNIEFSECVWYHSYIYHIFTFQGSGETSSFLNVYGTILIFIIYLLFRVRVKHRVFWMYMVPRLYSAWSISLCPCASPRYVVISKVFYDVQEDYFIAYNRILRQFH